MERKVVATP